MAAILDVMLSPFEQNVSEYDSSNGWHTGNRCLKSKIYFRDGGQGVLIDMDLPNDMIRHTTFQIDEASS